MHDIRTHRVRAITGTSLHMQKTSTHPWQSEDDQFADNSEEVDTSALLVSTGGRPLCNLQFADDIDLLQRDSEKELTQLTDRLEKTAAGYGMEISSDASKILVNSVNPSQ